MKKILILFVLLTSCAATNVMLVRGGKLLYNTPPVDLFYSDISAGFAIDVILAIETINKAAGCTIINKPIYSDTTVDCTDGCIFLENEPLPPALGGVCTFWIDARGRIVSSIVTIPFGDDIWKQRIMIIVHELMHSLGFGHNTDIGQVMHPTVKFANLSFSDAQIKILQLYCSLSN